MITSVTKALWWIFVFGTPQGPEVTPLGLGDTQTRPITAGGWTYFTLRKRKQINRVYFVEGSRIQREDI